MCCGIPFVVIDMQCSNSYKYVPYWCRVLFGPLLWTQCSTINRNKLARPTLDEITRPLCWGSYACARVHTTFVVTSETEPTLVKRPKSLKRTPSQSHYRKLIFHPDPFVIP